MSVKTNKQRKPPRNKLSFQVEVSHFQNQILNLNFLTKNEDFSSNRIFPETFSGAESTFLKRV